MTATYAGERRRVQEVALLRVTYALDSGLTARELSDLTGWHHGQASGALSWLHKGGEVARLRERRQGFTVYVLPVLVGGRETIARKGAGA